MLCNNGYTIERFIHGFEDEYNDINNWNYNGLIDVFNGPEKGARTFRVKTKGEAEKLFTDAEFNAAKVLQFVELHMPWDDAPPALVVFAPPWYDPVEDVEEESNLKKLDSSRSMSAVVRSTRVCLSSIAEL